MNNVNKIQWSVSRQRVKPVSRPAKAKKNGRHHTSHNTEHHSKFAKLFQQARQEGAFETHTQIENALPLEEPILQQEVLTELNTDLEVMEIELVEEAFRTEEDALIQEEILSEVSVEDQMTQAMYATRFSAPLEGVAAVAPAQQAARKSALPELRQVEDIVQAMRVGESKFGKHVHLKLSDSLGFGDVEVRVMQDQGDVRVEVHSAAQQGELLEKIRKVCAARGVSISDVEWIAK